jgi:trimethylamine---corrinoid protein Co-methyltransferase
VKRNLQAGHRKSGGLRLEVFTPDELRDIHLGTLDVLERTGVHVASEEARGIFAGAGARVQDNEVVKIPGHVVEEAIRTTPSRLVMYGRDPKNDVVLEDGRVNFLNFGEGVFIVDAETGKLRQTLKSDVAECSRLIDALPQLDVILRPLGAHDVPEPVGPLHNAEAIFTNCSKHAIIGPISGYLATRMREMAAAIAGGAERLRERPIFSYVVCPISPLQLPRDVCDVLIEGAREGVPTTVVSMALAGGSAPVNLAGAVIVHNAEVLAALTLSQLTCKGASMVYGSSTTALDLRYAAATVGSPECGLINAGIACLARHYGLPSWVAGL